MKSLSKTINIPAYPLKAYKGILYLFRPYNDIDVFIEDTSCKALYEILIERFLDRKAKVRRIFPLGGRQAVINKCSSNQTTGNRNRIYIIDGDFDALFNRQVAPNLRYIYQLKLYCVENLLFCKHAIHEIARESLTNTLAHDVKRVIDFDNFKADILDKLRILFIVYGATHLLDNTIETMGYSVVNLIDNNVGNLRKLSPNKIRRRIKYIVNKLLINKNTEDIRSAIKQVRDKIPKDDDETIKLISGKSYIIPLLDFYLRDKATYRGTKNQLKLRLANHCRKDIEPEFVLALKSVIK